MMDELTRMDEVATLETQKLRQTIISLTEELETTKAEVLQAQKQSSLTQDSNASESASL